MLIHLLEVLRIKLMMFDQFQAENTKKLFIGLDNMICQLKNQNIALPFLFLNPPITPILKRRILLFILVLTMHKNSLPISASHVINLFVLNALFTDFIKTMKSKQQEKLLNK
jgi:hypothetical protein